MYGRYYRNNYGSLEVFSDFCSGAGFVLAGPDFGRGYFGENTSFTTLMKSCLEMSEPLEALAAFRDCLVFSFMSILG